MSKSAEVCFKPSIHAATAKFSANKPRANSLNSTGSEPYTSTATVSAVCERRLASFFPSFDAKRPSDSPGPLSGETGLSLGLRKVAADEPVSRLVLALFRRYQVARLIPISLHGWVFESDLASYSSRASAPLAR